MTSRACVFIDSNHPKVRNRLINTNSFIKPKFPPKIDLRALITKQTFTDSSRSSGRAPNAFIIYRKAYVEAARKDGYQLPMTVVSSMASRSWDLEPEFVKEEYRKLAKEANAIRNKLIPKYNKKKRQKWNIVSFPPSNSNNKSSSLSPTNKTKTTIKKKKEENKEISSSSSSTINPPNEKNSGISFHIPYDVSSQIVDRYRYTFLDDSFDNLHSNPSNTNSVQQQLQHDFNYNNFNNFIPQSIETDTQFYNQENQESTIEEQIVDVAVDIPTDTNIINTEFEYDSLGFFTFFNDYAIPYPSFWEEY